MTNKHLVRVIMLGLSMLCGYGGISNMDNNSKNTQNEDRINERKEEEDDMDDVLTLTREQEELLLSVSVNEKKILSGELYSWQKELLNQYDFALEYLKTKYPSHSFYITGCAPISKGSSYATFWFQVDNEKKIYEVHLSIEDGYICEDNYYNDLFSIPYGEELKTQIQKDIPECVGVSVEFFSLQGDKYGQSYDYKMLMSGEDSISNSTTIYLDGSEEKNVEELLESVKLWIQNRGIYGAYTVIVLNQLPEKTDRGSYFDLFMQEQGDSVCLLKSNFQQFN